MKKMLLSMLSLVLLVGGALWAYEEHHDVLAAGLFMCALIPSCLFEAGRKELRGE